MTKILEDTKTMIFQGEEHLQWLQRRRSTRQFSDRPVSLELLERLLQAAITAPSNTNRQPWRFASRSSTRSSSASMSSK
jgi:nitroreductase